MEENTRGDWFSLADLNKDELAASFINQPACFVIIGTIYFSSEGGGWGGGFNISSTKGDQEWSQLIGNALSFHGKFQ